MIVTRRVRHKSSALFSAADEWRTLNAQFFKGSDSDVMRIMSYSKDKYVSQGLVDEEDFKRHIDEIFKGRADPGYTPDWVKGMKDGELTKEYASANNLIKKSSALTETPKPPPKPPSKPISKPGLNSKLLLAGLAAAGLVGAGAYFIRRRRSSKGKQIIERVRRK